MAQMAHGLTDQEIDDLSEYFAALRVKTSQSETKASNGVERVR
jgi:cytochrome c553